MSLHFFSDYTSLGSTLKTAAENSELTVFVDENTLHHCWPKLVEHCNLLKDAEIIEIPVGEEAKSIEVCTHIWESLIARQISRKGLIINLGGGVVTDLGGFVAATYKRGIDFINIPTSLLAMVDAAIGGKTGINMGGLKNVVGSFKSAQMTCICPAFLSSLPETELLSGYAEMLKHAMIADSKLWTTLNEINPGNAFELEPYIEQCARIKDQIVKGDFEEMGERKLLNLGHTFGHAIEAYSHEIGEALPHGYCVAAGLLCESLLAFDLEICGAETLASIKKSVLQNYPIDKTKNYPFEKLYGYMKNDKKNNQSKVLFALPQRIGTCRFDIEASEDQCRLAWLEYTQALAQEL